MRKPVYMRVYRDAAVARGGSTFARELYLLPTIRNLYAGIYHQLCVSVWYSTKIRMRRTLPTYALSLDYTVTSIYHIMHATKTSKPSTKNCCKTMHAMKGKLPSKEENGSKSMQTVNYPSLM
jgi:hypothetical protein